MFSRMQSRTGLASFVVAVFLFLVYTSYAPDSTTLRGGSAYARAKAVLKGSTNKWPPSTFDSIAAETQPAFNSTEALDFWRSFGNFMYRGNLSFPGVRTSGNMPAWATFENVKQGEQAPNTLLVTEDELYELRDRHREALQTVDEMSDGLPFRRGTRGIAMTCNALDSSGIITTSLRMLRKVGSTLPVEIWFWRDQDIDEVMCKEVWAELGVTCHIVAHYLPQESDLGEHDKPLDVPQHFTMKIYSILFSSFEQVLFLDADLFPTMSPDSLFESEPFTSHGMILWPDYWANMASPQYLWITERTPIDRYQRASTESGAIVVNKRTHGATLLLSAYYNRWGPAYWYWLLDQGSNGHGDKETYLHAAEACNDPVYQVHTQPRRVGYRCEGQQMPIGSGQHHPEDDYAITRAGMHDQRSMLSDFPSPRVLFIHGNLPKLEAAMVLDFAPDGWLNLLRCNAGKGEAHRLFGPAEMARRVFGWDIERAIWDQMLWTACHHESRIIRWRDGVVWNTYHEDGSVTVNEGIPRPNVCVDFTKAYKDLYGETAEPDFSLPAHGTLKDRPWLPIAGSAS
ncbi:mannosyltransferase putative-domain-containing protein [Protomyces lactucae-debilis]|uniref:Mannosyltransferase putative-domain-containing protein n=1 Tax=Protomyces lactucae-debilis TaxID=2754530 RepID=A0A1Y2FJY6_PROLT|nr:mannosyltransferase putative-domain-containing protein [Protomyces lactucae-debilis]ORY84260.1 mannosyltransferase putative-domain-containing protein [Protomyces lactucae-debilis]